VISAIAEQRLRHQSITGPPRRTVENAVAWLGAVQAQEFAAAKWGLALRMPGGTTDARIEEAFNAGRILRTHVMRPTWHFVTPRDIRWMLELTGPRVQRLMQVYNRRMELDAPTLKRALAVIERVLAGGKPLTRVELCEQLACAGIAARRERLAHIMLEAELVGMICSGPLRDGKFTYMLLAERAPTSRGLPRDEALAELARRYFRSHGPATVRDFVWWSGLLTADATRGLEMIRARKTSVDNVTYWWMGDVDAHPARGHSAHLLPVYDEYLIAYRDRHAVPHRTIASWTGSFAHAFIIDGQIGGMWRAVRHAQGVNVELRLGRRLTRPERRALDEAAGRYSRFVQASLTVAVQ
jgi:winged helix DNA-binding protein